MSIYKQKSIINSIANSILSLLKDSGDVTANCRVFQSTLRTRNSSNLEPIDNPSLEYSRSDRGYYYYAENPHISYIAVWEFNDTLVIKSFEDSRGEVLPMNSIFVEYYIGTLDQNIVSMDIYYDPDNVSSTVSCLQMSTILSTLKPKKKSGSLPDL